jgi:hypothetical protein
MGFFNTMKKLNKLVGGFMLAGFTISFGASAMAEDTVSFNTIPDDSTSFSQTNSNRVGLGSAGPVSYFTPDWNYRSSISLGMSSCSAYLKSIGITTTSDFCK